MTPEHRKQVVEALREISLMYAHAWDRTDGALFMMPASIPRFEAAHEKVVAAIALMEAEEEQGWIPVSKKLPREGETVLCFFAPMVGEKFDGANFATATMSAPHHWHNPEDDEDDYAVPSLWMPILLPAPPVHPVKQP